jgi:micrococcal nuclease
MAPADIRIMIWLGLLLGLLIYQAMRLPPPSSALPRPFPPIAEAPDPYAEGRRSREILEEQERRPPSALGTEPRQSTRASGPVWVIDGDTFDYGGMRIRIADIDTPEVDGRCAYESQLAARATARMRALLGAGAFELHPTQDGRDEDRYGRKLRIVTRGGRSLGDQMVAEGLARTWTGRRQPWC